jgi:hypothetical protein
MVQAERDRRQHQRFPLGLPVTVRFVDRGDRLRVELVDISSSAARFRSDEPSEGVQLRQHGAFGFVLPGGPRCRATGEVFRIDREQFVLLFEETNEAFMGFIRLLAGPG